MPKLAPQHSAERRAACIHASLDARPTSNAPQIVAAAAAGTLPGADGQPLPAFVVPLSTVQWWARTERERRRTLETTATPDDTADPVADLRSRLLAVAQQLVRKHERDGAKANPADLRETARAVRDIAAISTTRNNGTSRASTTGDDTGADPEHDTPATPEPDLLDRLAAAGDDDTPPAA